MPAPTIKGPTRAVVGTSANPTRVSLAGAGAGVVTPGATLPAPLPLAMGARSAPPAVAAGALHVTIPAAGSAAHVTIN